VNDVLTKTKIEKNKKPPPQKKTHTHTINNNKKRTTIKITQIKINRKIKEPKQQTPVSTK